MHFILLNVSFFSAYTQADFFGKAIFIFLFVLSLISWFLIVHKIFLIREAKKFSEEMISLVEEGKDRILQLQTGKKFHPFLSLYHSLKKNTLEILKKNSFFANGQKVSLCQADIELISSHVEMESIIQLKKLEKNLFVLSTIVTLAPFLGLLGTVWGIYVTFSHLQTGSVANNAVLSGLSMALATTVVGLVVSIPALIGYNYAKNSIRDFGKEMESFSHKLLAIIEIQYRGVGSK